MMLASEQVTVKHVSVCLITVQQYESVQVPLQLLMLTMYRSRASQRLLRQNRLVNYCICNLLRMTCLFKIIV
jgi:hypothetical protein